MKIILTGGGTGGSVTPLIAIYQKLKKLDEDLEVLWLGQYEGVEKRIVSKYNISYKGISSGKFRRYWSWQNFVDPFKIIKGWWQAKKIIKNFKPDLILTAGSFVAVPVARAAKSYGIDLFVHQQDISIGLANRLMLPWAKYVNLTLTDLKYKLPQDIEILKYGNPVREEIENGSKERFCEKYNLDKSQNILLVLGGGTGAYNLNKCINDNILEIIQETQVVHVTGKGKNLRDFGVYYNEQYRVLEFLNAKEMGDALKSADFVLTRAGLSTLSELTVLGKAIGIVPLPDTHQEENAKYWTGKNAAKLFLEKDFADLPKNLVNILNDYQELKYLSKNIKKIMPDDAALKLANYFYQKYKN